MPNAAARLAQMFAIMGSIVILALAVYDITKGSWVVSIVELVVVVLIWVIEIPWFGRLLRNTMLTDWLPGHLIVRGLIYGVFSVPCFFSTILIWGGILLAIIGALYIYAGLRGQTLLGDRKPPATLVAAGAATPVQLRVPKPMAHPTGARRAVEMPPLAPISAASVSLPGGSYGTLQATVQPSNPLEYPETSDVSPMLLNAMAVPPPPPPPRI